MSTSRRAAVFVGPMIQLRTVPAFENLTSAQLSALASGVEEVVLQVGSPILDLDEPAEAIFLIEDGGVGVEETSGSRSHLGPGDVVGFLEALTREPVTRRTTAETDVVALKLEVEGLRDACDLHFGIHAALLRHVAGLVAADPGALRAAVGAGAEREGPAVEEGAPMDRVQRILELHRSPVFPSAGMDALAELAGHLTERELGAGDGLWSENAGPDGAFLICSGRVLLQSDRWSGTVELGPGALPGLVTTLTEDASGIRARALTPVRALYVSGETLLDILEDHADMAFAFLGRLASCALQGR